MSPAKQQPHWSSYRYQSREAASSEEGPKQEQHWVRLAAVETDSQNSNAAETEEGGPALPGNKTQHHPAVATQSEVAKAADS
jgi:hypothetical protein